MSNTEFQPGAIVCSMARVKNVFSDTSIVYNYISGDICSEMANGDHIIENTSISWL